MTELFEGGSLHEYLHTKELFVPKRSEALRMAVSIARGMSYLNSQKPPLLHRDIKPRNVLLSSGVDGKPHVAICDFGLCKLFTDCEDNNDRSGKAEVMGTANYMSPNVLAGNIFCSADDVYSFGILLCELLTGRLPYNGVRPINVIFGVAEDGLRPEIRDEDNICRDLRELIVGCWQEELTDRPNISDVTTCLEVMYEESLVDEKGKAEVGIGRGGNLTCKKGVELDLVMNAPVVDLDSSLSTVYISELLVDT